MTADHRPDDNDRRRQGERFSYRDGVHRRPVPPRPPTAAPAPDEDAEPVSRLATAHDLPGFPVDCLPPVIATFVRELADELEVPPDLPGCLALAVLASIWMRLARVEARRNWQESLNLYLVVALTSGERKSPVFGRMFGPLYDHERDRHEQWRLECQAIDDRNEGIKKADREPHPPQPRLFVDDVTQEKLAEVMSQQGERITLRSDEGTAFQQMCGLYSKSPNNTVFLKAYDGSSYYVDRVGRPGLALRRPLLTVALAVQPSVLRGLAERPELRGTGLLARFCYAVPVPRVGTRSFETPLVSLEAAAAYRELVRGLARLEPVRGPDGEESTMLLSPDAWNLLLATQQAREPELGIGGRLASIRDWVSKSDGLALRLAALLHGTEEATPFATPIPGEVMARALTLVRYFERHAQFVLESEIGADPVELLARDVWQLIERKGWTKVTPRQISRSVWSVRKAADALAALEHLRDRGLLLPDPQHRGTGAGYLVRQSTGPTADAPEASPGADPDAAA